MRLIQFGNCAIAVSAITLLASCSNIGLREPPNRARTQEEAGSVHFAVLSVGNWEDYKAALQPQFSLTAEKARELAIAPTRSIEDGFLDATRFAATISPEVRVSTSSQTTSTDTSGKATTTGTSTSQQKPAGDSPPAPPSDNALPSDLRATAPALASDMGSDPTTVYTTDLAPEFRTP